MLRAVQCVPAEDTYDASGGVDFHFIAVADVSEDSGKVHDGWNTEFAGNDGAM
jgi:hypothetical protein